MPVIRIGDLTTYAGDTSGSWLVVNDPTNTTTYKAQKEQLLSGNFAGTASYAFTASYVDAANVVGLNLSQIASGSATASISPGLFNVNTNTNIGGDITASNALFTGTITAQRLSVQVITSSTEFITGSTRFGSFLTDTHQFTGSVSITGSLLATASWAANATTGAVQVVSSSGTALPYRPSIRFNRMQASDDSINGQAIVTRPADTFISASAPANPVEGDVWTNNNNWKTYKYYDNYWVEQTVGGGLAAGSNGNDSYFGTNFDGQGGVVLVGTRSYARIPKAGTITGWSIVAEGTNPTCTVDVWKTGSGASLPNSGSSITAAAKPALSSGNATLSSTLTNWTASFAANDIFAFNVSASSAATKINFVLKVTYS